MLLPYLVNVVNGLLWPDFRGKSVESVGWRRQRSQSGGGLSAPPGSIIDLSVSHVLNQHIPLTNSQSLVWLTIECEVNLNGD